MTTLLLAHYPFGELLSDFVLREAVEALRLPPGTLLAAPDWAQRRAEALGLALAAPGADPVPLGIRHVVILGPYIALPAFVEALGVARRVLEAGGSFSLHNVSLEGSANRKEPPPEAAILDHATDITARDHRTVSLFAFWRVARGVPILSYPERRIAPDPALVDGLGLAPGKRLLGLSVRGAPDVRAYWASRVEALRESLAEFQGWPVLPLPAGPPADSGEVDDATGTRDFVAAVWPGARLVRPEILQRVWWQRNMTPARYAALVAACSAIVTQRDLAAELAVEAGVPVQALLLTSADRRAVTCIATLANELVAGSAVTHFLTA